MGVVLWLPLFVVGAACGLLAWAVRGRSSTVFAPSVWKGPRNRRAIALTFDDGPSESTPAILQILAEQQARATFFLCGVNVERLPRIARSVVEGGHEVANHSYSHSRFDFRPQEFMRVDLEDAQIAIQAATGNLPTLFRAPYGVRWFGLGAVQKQLNLLGVMWTAIGLDWKLSPDAIAKRLESAATNGAIFCLHDGRETDANPSVSSTIDALKILLPRLRAKGYELVTVSELLAQRP